MWKSNIRMLVVFFVAFTFVSCQPYSKSSFETKQSETHEQETHEEKTQKDSIYLTRGSEKPSSLLKEAESTNTTPSTSEEEIEPTNITPECTNFLYYKDYIIFQASLGTKNSNFYLLAFNTLDGTITKIHRGMHDKFFIYKNMLYFEQHDNYYSCTFEEFQPNQISYFFDDPYFISDEDQLDLKNYQEDIPEEYKVLDLYYINQVLTGSFSQPLIDETLFLTGDFNYSKVGIIEKQTKLFAPVINGCLKFEHGDNDSGTFLNFWQSMIADVDNDKLDEIVSLNYSKNSAECVVYIWEYSQEEEKMVSYRSKNIENISMPELIRKNDKIYLQCSYFIDYSSEIKQRELKYNPNKRKIFSLDSCKKELATELYKKPEMLGLSEFQFLENPANGESDLEIVETKSKGFPLVKIPDKYNVTGNKLTKKEQEYVQKRNTRIDEFIELLDSGVDPFEGIWIDLVGYDKASPYNVALRVNEEIDYKCDTIPIYSIDTLIPIKEKETEYIIIRAVDTWNGRHIFLFSDQFKFLDVVSNDGNGAEYEADTIVSLKHPNHFWFSTRMFRGPYILFFMCVNNSKLNYKTPCHSGSPNLIKKEGEPFFLINNLHMYIAGPRDSSISGYEYIDPWSGESVNQLFLEEMKMQLDHLYSCYQYYHADLLTPGRIEGSGGNTITLEDGRTKHLYVSISAGILEKYESVFYRYGWK